MCWMWCVKPLLTHSFWQWAVLFSCFRNRATDGTASSSDLDSLQDVWDLWCMLGMHVILFTNILEMKHELVIVWQLYAVFVVVTTILFAHTAFLWATCSLIYSYQPLSRSWRTDLDYGSYCLPNLEIGLLAVWPVNNGCLLLLGTWSHLWCIQRSVFAHSAICIWDWLLFVIYAISCKAPVIVSE
jgi:hypothetical protein